MGKDEKHLVDVPVMVTNYRSTDKDNAEPNKGGINMETSQLVRRFFLFDTLSGLDQT